MSQANYVIGVHDSPLDIDAASWNHLLSLQDQPTPFMQHEYLLALHASGSASPATGWIARFMTLRDPVTGDLQAACPAYLKNHSRGEYVFDWGWAEAYVRHGLDYYPKAIVAVPFTPVPGTRLLARNESARQALIKALIEDSRLRNLSSLHLLFASPGDIDACCVSGLMPRQTIQFHWRNKVGGYADFDDFLNTLVQDKRKKIRQERRKVAEAGVTFRCKEGRDISAQEWEFFYQCYERTYLEHGNAPYLHRDFFLRMAQTMPQHWLLFVAQRQGRDIAASLIAISARETTSERVAWGRYWGALERVDCLHFEACYYRPLQWCIEHAYQRFEGGAQGEHKLARALLPVKTQSVHWLRHPEFATAIERFLVRESQGIDNYLIELRQRAPLKRDS